MKRWEEEVVEVQTKCSGSFCRGRGEMRKRDEVDGRKKLADEALEGGEREPLPLDFLLYAYF